MTRKQQLEKLFDEVDGREVIAPLLDDVVFLEERLVELRKMPFIRVNPKNPAMQKSTPAAKLYKELLQQYNNCVKILIGVLKANGIEEVSPLREFISRLP